jgi:hypothetical protein
MIDMSAFMRAINKDRTPHTKGDVIEVDEWHFTSTCVTCGKKIDRMFIEADEDRPARWTGWGYCDKKIESYGTP